MLAAFLINVAAALSAQSAGSFYFSLVSPPRIHEPIPCPPTIACEQYTLVNVMRAGGTTGRATVDLVVGGGTATPDVDYDVASDFGARTGANTYTLVFAPGDAGPHYVFIVPHADQEIEPDETVPLVLTNPTGGATLGIPSTATVVILDSTTDPRSQGVPMLDTAGLALLGIAIAATAVLLLTRR